MATTNEGIRFDGDSDSLKRALDAIEKGLVDVAEAFGGTVKAASRLNKAGTGLNQLQGQILKTAEDGQKFRASFKLSAKEIRAFIKSGGSLPQLLKRIGVGFQATAKNADEQAKAVRAAREAQSEFNRQLSAGQAIGAETAQLRQGAATATAPELLNFSKIEDQLKRLASTSRVTGDQITRIFEEAARGEVRDYGVEINRVRNQIFRLIKASEEFGVTAQKAAEKAQKAQADFNRQVAAGQAIGAETSRLRRLAPATTSTTELLNFSKTEDQLKRLVVSSQVTGDQLRKIFREAARGEIRDYGLEVNRVRDKVFELTKVSREFGSQAQKAAERARRAQQKANKAVEEGTTLTGKLVKSVKGLARVAGVSLFVGSLFRLQEAFEQALLSGGELSIKIAEIETIQGKATLSTETWTNELRRLSDTFGLDILDQAEGAYQTLSTQVAKGAESVQFLETANKLALAGITDVGSAVKLTATLINSYNKDVSEAGDISGKLFRTVELGVVRIEELANGLGRLSVPAAAAGIRLEELLAAIAQTTRRGVQFNEAATLLRGIIQKTIKPTEEMAQVLEELGFSSGEAAIQTLGFGRFLEELDKRTQGSSTELGKLFNRVRAVTGSLIFAGRGVEEFNTTLTQIDTSGVETLDAATARIQATLGKRFDRLANQIKNVFLVDIGQPVLNTLLNITEGLIKFGSDFGKVVKSVSQNAVVVNTALTALTFSISVLALKNLPLLIINLQLGAQSLLAYATSVEIAAAANTRALITFIRLNPELFVAAAAIAATTLAYKLTVDAIQESKQEVEDFTASINQQTKALVEGRDELLKLANADIIKGLKERNRVVREALSEENKEIDRANRARIESLEEVRKTTDVLNKELVNGFKAAASRAGAEYRKLAGQVQKTSEDIRKSFQTASKDLLQFDINIVADKAQLRLVENQIQNLQVQQQAAAQAGNKAAFEQATSQLKTLTKQRFEAIARISKAQAQADQNVFNARAALVRAEQEGNKDNIQAARDAIKDAEQARRVVGTAGKEELDVQQQIVKVRRALSRAPFQSAEAEALKLELDGLRRLQLQINNAARQEEEQRKQILATFEEERRLRLQLQDELIAKQKEAFKEQVKQQLVVAKITQLEKERRAFNLEKVLGTGDEEKITKEVLKQLDVLQELQQLQKDLGVSAADRASVEREIFLTRKAANEAIFKEENNAFLTRLSRFEEEQQVRLKQAREVAKLEDKADIERIARLQAGLAGAANELKKIGGEEFNVVVGRNDRGDTAGDINRRTLVNDIDSLIKQLQINEKNPGLVEVTNIEDLARKLAASAVEGEAAGPQRFQGQELLEAVKGQLDVAGRSLVGQLQFLTLQLQEAQKRLTSGDERFRPIVEFLEREVKRRAEAEAKGVEAAEGSISATLNELQTRQETLQQLKSSFDVELKALKDRAIAAAKAATAEADFARIAQDFNDGLNKLKDDLSNLAFNRTLVQAASKPGQDAAPTVEPGKRDLLSDRLAIADSSQSDFTQARVDAEKAARPEAEGNAIAGARAARPIELETARQAAIEGIKAKASEEKRIQDAKTKAEQESLRVQQRLAQQEEQQRKIRESSQGLTGFAAQVAEADARSGLGSAADQRAKEAKDRADQRARNEQFLRDRREQKIREAEAARAQESQTAGSGGLTAPLIEQTKVLLEQAQQRAAATPGDVGSQQAVKDLTTQLKALEKLQQEQLKQAQLPQQKAFPDLKTAQETAKQEAALTKVVLLDDTQPLELLTGALNDNTEALKAFQRIGPRQGPDQFGNITPIGSTIGPVQAQRLPPAPLFPDMVFAPEVPVEVTVPVDVEINLDGKKVAGYITDIVDRSLARKARQGTSRSQR